MSALFHSPSKKIVQRFWTSVGRRCACLKKETTLSNVSGFTLAAASFCLVGAARRGLPAKNAMIVSQDFISLRQRIWAARVHDSGRPKQGKMRGALRTQRYFPKERVQTPFCHGWRSR